MCVGGEKDMVCLMVIDIVICYKWENGLMFFSGGLLGFLGL